MNGRRPGLTADKSVQNLDFRLPTFVQQCRSDTGTALI